MKTPTPKRAAAALILDGFDQLRCGCMDDIKDEHAAEIMKQIEKILRPIEDRLWTITGDDANDIRRHYETV